MYRKSDSVTKNPFLAKMRHFTRTQSQYIKNPLQIVVPWKGLGVLVFIAEKLWIAKNVRDLCGINDFDPTAYSLPSRTQ